MNGERYVINNKSLKNVKKLSDFLEMTLKKGGQIYY